MFTSVDIIAVLDSVAVVDGDVDNGNVAIDSKEAFADAEVVLCLCVFAVSCAKADVVTVLPCCASAVTDANADVFNAAILSAVEESVAFPDVISVTTYETELENDALLVADVEAVRTTLLVVVANADVTVATDCNEELLNSALPLVLVTAS